jgi:nitrate/TMAO reductase-like tetraheme cytochrome c subunit
MTKPIEPTKTPEPMVPTEPNEAVGAAEQTEASQAAEADNGANPVRRFRRTRRAFAPAGRVLAKIPHPPLRSKRGLFVLVLLIAGFGTIAGAGSVMAIHFSETSKFCGMCHTMDPELKAYAMSPHKEVACAECHVEPGVAGFVKAKANGTKQLIGIVTGKYPTPIPPPDHAHLPSVKDTCLECHEVDKLTENGGPVKLVLRARYKPDETNTRESVAIMLRPAGLGQPSAKEGASPDGAEGGVRGVHWHIQQKVTYTSSDEHAQKIDLVEITAKDGAKKQYIAGSKVAVSEDVQVDVDALKLSQTSRVMDCMDCHNRVGHAVPSPERAVDEAMADGKISTALPFIKRDSVALLKGNYPTLEAADKAINSLRTSYATKYPLVLKNHDEQVTGAIDELKQVYRLVATPAMKVQAKTYPDNLGHQTSPGCFRCHDDAHFLVVKGKVTNKKIPSTCATCHTFPQVGSSASSFPLGAKPVDHKDKLYVFSHKHSVKTSNPTGTTCAGCHAPSYCENCHSSGAIKVKHNAMSYNHAKVIKTAGSTQACAYCHLPVYCEKCHKKPVLEPSALPPGVVGKPKP